MKISNLLPFVLTILFCCTSGQTAPSAPKNPQPKPNLHTLVSVGVEQAPKFDGRMVMIHLEVHQDGVVEVRHLIAGRYSGIAIEHDCASARCSVNLGQSLQFDAIYMGVPATFEFTLLSQLEPIEVEPPTATLWGLVLTLAGRNIPLVCREWQSLPVEVGKTGRLLAVTCFGQIG